MAKFLDLPLEILVETICYLNVVDTYTCRRLCRTLYNLISDSMKLQYVTKIKIAGMQDNPYCKLSIPERLSTLERREISWRLANYTFFTGMEVPSPWSGVYDLTSSVYLLGKSSPDVDSVTTGVQTIRLPYTDQGADHIEWTEFNFGMDIIDFGTAIEEHDLLACVSLVSDEQNAEVRHIVLVLFRYSNQKMHDECVNPILHLCRSERVPSISIEISGENVAVIVAFDNSGMAPAYRALYILDWKSGKAKSPPLPVNNTGLTFLREDLLLNPNIVQRSLDIYRIPSTSATSSGTPIRLAHSFLLPILTRGYCIANVSCRSGPNPTANASFPKYTRPNRPFSHDPACAIIIFTFELMPAIDFVMIVHRKALLDLIFLPFDRGIRSSQSASRIAFPGLATPWQLWGPPITRWFYADEFETAFITTTAGQRCVQYVPSARNGPHRADLTPDTIVILDFNPWHVKLADYDQKVSGLGSAVLVGTGRMAYEHEANICLSRGAFEEHIQCSLPFVACKVPKKWDYDAVLLDEERILGIRTDDEPHETASVDVMYFG